MVVHGGSSYRFLLLGQTLQGHFDQLLAQLKIYAKNVSIPLLTAHEDLPTLAWLNATSRHRLEDLVKPLTDRVALAPALQMAIDALPASEPGLITIVSDFEITDPNELTKLVEQTLKRHPLFFLRFVFLSSANRGNDILPFLLEERTGGPLNMVDSLFLTHVGGRKGESIETAFDRKLSTFVVLLNAHTF